MNTIVDRTSPVPYYVQVKAALQDQIRRGEWQTGEQIPPESDLCQMFNVSRTVIRQALNELMHEGLIRREKGRGTFVAERKIQGRLVRRLAGFHEDMVSQGYAPPISHVLKQGIIPADAHIANMLDLEPGQLIVEIQRLRFVQDEPIALVTTYLPEFLVPGLVMADFRHQSLYEFLRVQYGIEIATGRRTIEAVAASPEEAELLGVECRAPLILLDSVSFLEDGRPVEYYRALHRGDRSRFEVELVRRDEP